MRKSAEASLPSIVPFMVTVPDWMSNVDVLLSFIERFVVVLLPV